MTTKVETAVITMLIVTTFVAYGGHAYDFDQYYTGSGDTDYSGTHGNRRYCREDKDCYFTPEPYCCLSLENSHVCCKEVYHRVGNAADYRKVKTRCDNGYGLYWCPPWDEPGRKYCCFGGCCSIHDSKKSTPSHPETEKNSINQSGVTSIGAIAGFVFLAVIIVGTLLTLATRYIKIKVRREHRRAGIHSQAYIDAMNQRSVQRGMRGQDSGDGNNSESSTRQPPSDPAPQVFYIQTIPEEDGEDENAGVLPPSYDEAMATCPVVVDEDPQTEIRQPETCRRNIVFRPPSRPPLTAGSDFESMPLSVRKENYDPIDESHRDARCQAARNTDDSSQTYARRQAQGTPTTLPKHMHVAKRHGTQTTLPKHMHVAKRQGTQTTLPKHDDSEA